MFLKIKDNVDMKELEKFGFAYGEYWDGDEENPILFKHYTFMDKYRIQSVMSNRYDYLGIKEHNTSKKLERIIKIAEEYENKCCNAMKKRNGSIKLDYMPSMSVYLNGSDSRYLDYFNEEVWSEDLLYDLIKADLVEKVGE